MSKHNSVGLLLAAGFGRRFDPTGDQNKLMQVLPNGVPVAVQTVRNLLRAVKKVVAVVSSPELVQVLSVEGCEVHLFKQAELGMGASLAFAVRQIVQPATQVNSQVDSILVTLADMPYVRMETNQKVVEELVNGADIAQPYYPAQTKSGHPIGFSKRHFPALMALTGDVGARHLLREFAVRQVIVDDPGILRDIDFSSDLL